MIVTAVRTVRGLGNVAPGESDLILGTIASFTGTSRPPPLIYAHGVADSTDTGFPSQLELMKHLAQFFTVVTAHLGGDAWANDTHIARIEAARLYLNSAWGCSGKVTLCGTSMGAAGVLAYTMANPSNVRAVAGVIPALDIADLRANRGLSVSIDLAYSGGYSAATYGAAHNPATFAASVSASIPVHLFNSSTDTTAVPATVTAFKSARPATMVKDCGTAGHSDATIATALPHVVSFCRNLTQQ